MDERKTDPVATPPVRPSPDAPPEEIRREIADTRARIDHTLDTIQYRLSPSHLAEQSMNAIKRRSKKTGNRLVAAVRNHPMPAALTGAGLAWLIGATVRERTREQPEHRTLPSGRGMEETELRARMDLYEAGIETQGSAYEEELSRRGGGESSSEAERASAMGEQAKDRAKEYGEQARHRAQEYGQQAKQRARQLGERARQRGSEMGQRVREQASEIGDRMREQMSGAGESLRRGASRAGESVRHGAEQARDTGWDTFKSYPLTSGLAVLAAGMLAGLLIPSTRTEDRWMGEQRDELMHGAKRYGEQLMEKGQAVASSAAEAARESAREEGLTPGQIREEGSERLRHVAESAGEAAKQEAKRQGQEMRSGEGEGEAHAQSAEQRRSQEEARRPDVTRGEGENI